MGVVIVTGGSRGIGADICRLAAQRGHTVCVNYLRGKNEADAVVAEITKSGGHAISGKADVTVAHSQHEALSAEFLPSLQISERRVPCDIDVSGY